MKLFSRSVLLVPMIVLAICSCNKDGLKPTTTNSPDSLSANNSFSARWHKPTTPTTPTTPTPPATGPNVVVGDGSSALTIDGNVTKYAAGTTITVKPGTYANSINIQNLTGVTIIGTGVTLDGLNQTKNGFYNCLNLNNLNSVTISGFTTQNNGYRMVNINSKMVGLTLDKCMFTNCLQGIYISGGQNIVWNGTDNTVDLLNFSITNSTFNNCGVNFLGGNVGNGQVTNLVKNLVISGNTFTGGNPGNIFQVSAVDGFQIFNNKITNVNLSNTNDNRLFMMIGNGDAYGNSFNNYEGHAIGIWPVTFGTVPKVCHIHNNTCTNSFRYAAFEMQEFASFAIPGVTTHADLVVDSNIAGNINTSQWTTYPGTFIDNYQFGIMGASTTLTNNVGYNWFAVPAPGVYWNLAKPSVVSGNTYTATAP